MLVVLDLEMELVVRALASEGSLEDDDAPFLGGIAPVMLCSYVV